MEQSNKGTGKGTAGQMMLVDTVKDYDLDFTPRKDERNKVNRELSVYFKTKNKSCRAIEKERGNRIDGIVRSKSLHVTRWSEGWLSVVYS